MKQFKISDLSTELADLDARRLKVVADIAPDEKIDMPWRKEILVDKQEEAKKKLGPLASAEAIQAALEKAKNDEVLARQHALVINHLSGTAIKTLEQAEKLMNAVEASEAEFSEVEGALVLAARVLPRIPAERRANAMFTSDSGYYWGGDFQQFVDQEDSPHSPVYTPGAKMMYGTEAANLIKSSLAGTEVPEVIMIDE